jgi:hypothetical protein
MIKAAQRTAGSVADRMQAMSKQFPDAIVSELADVLNEVGAITDTEHQDILENGFDLFPEAAEPSMKRDLVWSSGEFCSYSSVTQCLASASWKVIMLGFAWCDYYREGVFVRRYTRKVMGQGETCVTSKPSE